VQNKYPPQKEIEKMTITSNDLSSFGALLKDFRKRRHVTQQQLAETIGVHRSAIGRWEQGDFLPENKGIVLELAKHLHLSDQEARHLLEASLTALSPHWLVPLPRNPFFTGREEILEALHTRLGGRTISYKGFSTPAVNCIHMPGVAPVTSGRHMNAG
jgi:transcriptional regulator with XRE-family HTH domain